MGLDITVLVVDWDHLGRMPAAERLAMLEDAAYPDDDCDEGGGADARVEHGWVRWPEMPWCALYEFFETLGSFKPHFWAGQAWEDVRDFAEPGLRAALDAFLAGLFWMGLDDDADTGRGTEDEPAVGLFPAEPDPWHPRLLVVRTPEQVPDLARAWAVAAPLLEGLREPYAIHAERPGRWIANFEEFAMLLRDWGEVVTEASRSGRGLIGLPI